MADFDYWTEDGAGLTESDVREAFGEMLDESYETVTIAGIEFFPSDILRECDPVAYHVYSHDYASGMVAADEWFEQDPTEDDDSDN